MIKWKLELHYKFGESKELYFDSVPGVMMFITDVMNKESDRDLFLGFRLEKEEIKARNLGYPHYNPPVPSETVGSISWEDLDVLEGRCLGDTVD